MGEINLIDILYFTILLAPSFFYLAKRFYFYESEIKPNVCIIWSIVSFIAAITFFFHGGALFGHEYTTLDSKNIGGIFLFVIHILVVSEAASDFVFKNKVNYLFYSFVPFVVLSALVIDLKHIIMLCILTLIFYYSQKKFKPRGGLQYILMLMLLIGSTLSEFEQLNQFVVFILVMTSLIFVGLSPLTSCLSNKEGKKATKLTRLGLVELPFLFLIITLLESLNLSLEWINPIIICALISLVCTPLICLAQTNMYKVQFYIREYLNVSGILMALIGRIDLAIGVWVFSLIATNLLGMNLKLFEYLDQNQKNIKQLKGLKQNFSSFYLLGLLSLVPLLAIPGTSGLFVFYEIILSAKLQFENGILIYILLLSLVLFFSSVYRFLWYTLVNNEQEIEKIEIPDEVLLKVAWGVNLALVALSVVLFIPDIFSSSANGLLSKWVSVNTMETEISNYGFQSKNLILLAVVLLSLASCALNYSLYIKNLKEKYVDSLKFRFYGVWTTFHSEFKEILGFRIFKEVKDKENKKIDILDITKNIFITFPSECIFFVSSKFLELRPKGINSNLLYMSVGLMFLLFCGLVSF